MDHIQGDMRVEVTPRLDVEGSPSSDIVCPSWCVARPEGSRWSLTSDVWCAITYLCFYLLDYGRSPTRGADSESTLLLESASASRSLCCIYLALSVRYSTRCEHSWWTTSIASCYHCTYTLWVCVLWTHILIKDNNLRTISSSVVYSANSAWR